MIPKNQVKKILVITLSNIGDVILTTPILSALKQYFPHSELVVMVGPKAFPLLKGSDTVTRAEIYDKRVSWVKKFFLVLKLKNEHFDLIVDIRNTAFPHLLQPKFKLGMRFDRNLKSMRSRHLSILDGAVPDPGNNDFQFFNESEKRTAFKKMAHCSGLDLAQPFVAIAPGAGSELKRWKQQGFVWLIQYLRQRGQAVAVLGSEDECELGKSLEVSSDQGIVNLTGKLELRETAALISEAALVISNDSAIMHLGSELRRPVVALFGPTNAEKYGPSNTNSRIVRSVLDCMPCELAECRIERRKCLDDLPLEQVIAACEELLDREADQPKEDQADSHH